VILCDRASASPGDVSERTTGPTAPVQMKGITLNKRMDRCHLGIITGLIATALTSGCVGPREIYDETPVVAAHPVYKPVEAPTAEPVDAPQRTIRSDDLQPSAPETYVVRKGDTLWGIAKRFLKNPWYWPEIWHSNPDIRNPHLIYPGDVISLYYVNGEPRLGINMQRVPGDTKLKPRIRTYPLEEKDVGIAIQAVKPFLIRPQVVSEEALEAAPHVLDSRDARLIYGSGDQVYVHGLDNGYPGQRFSVFRPGKPLVDPKTGERLGFEAIHASEAELIREGDPATIELQKTTREVLRGDRLLPLDPGPTGFYFIPHAPAPGLEGTIVSLFDALNQAAQYQIAVINLGQRDGIEPGHVLEIRQAGRTISDPFHKHRDDTMVSLPTESSGLMMVFRSFDKVSYGLIMESDHPIRTGDIVTAP